MTRTRLFAVLIPVLLVLVAGVVRFVDLGHPERIIFDETYYVNDAREFLETGVEESFAVHPPVGKWLIAGGIAVFGDRPLGWRAAGAVAGTLVVLLTYLMARRLVGWRGAAALAGLLVAVDGLLFVQSRTSMLDAFLGLFVALGAWLLLVDYDESRLAEERTVVTDGLPWRPHPFRLLAGLAFGLAIATKWSGLLALGGAGLLVIGWELAWRRRLTGRFRVALGKLAGSVALSLVLVPLGVYAVSYIPWLVNYATTTEGDDVCAEEGPCHVSIPGRLAGLARYHVKVWNFHTDLEATHPYRAPAWTWPIMQRPVVYYWESCSAERAAGEATTNDEGEAEEPEPCVVAQGNAGEIIALGNPALWWGVLAALVPLGAGLAMRENRAWFIFTFWAAQFVPWLAVQRASFFFYMVPAVPFMALAMAHGVTWLDEVVERRALRGGREPRWRRVTPGATAGAVVAVAALALFLYFYPVLAGLEMDYDAVRQRWWLDTWI
ncbi:MAG: phospholipid carrier-dependent glycosyltransferase [Nitriliruptorales bacterium]